MKMFRRKNNIREAKIKLKEKKIGELIDSMLEKDLEIHSAPLSKEYFILDKENRISICVSESCVKLSNHNYLYEIPFSANTADKYIKKVQKKIQERSEIIKKGLFKNEIELIDNIKNKYYGEPNKEGIQLSD